MTDFAIVVGTSPGRESWLRDCLSSIDREVFVVSNFGFELAKIEFIFKKTAIERFVLLHDSVRVLDNRMFDILSESKGAQCLVDDPGHFGSYMGVYERNCLEAIDFPKAFSKTLSIFYEKDWTQRYLRIAGGCGHVLGSMKFTRTEFIHGRMNQVYSNEYLEKYKGDWGQIRHDDSLEDAISLGDVGLQKQVYYSPGELAAASSIRESASEVIRLSAVNLGLKKELDSKIDTIQEINQSLSWRVTEPLRKVAKCLVRK